MKRYKFWGGGAIYLQHCNGENLCNYDLKIQKYHIERLINVAGFTKNLLQNKSYKKHKR